MGNTIIKIDRIEFNLYESNLNINRNANENSITSIAIWNVSLYGISILINTAIKNGAIAHI